MTADRNEPRRAKRRWTRVEVDKMDHDDLVVAFMEEHCHEPDAQELHDFVNLMIGEGETASCEEVDEILAESELAQADEQQVLEKLRQQHPDLTNAELMRTLDPVGQIMRQNPGASLDKILEMIRAAGF